MEKDVTQFLLLNKNEKNLFLNNIEKNAFLVLSDEICSLFRGYNHKEDINNLKLINDIYNKIFIPLIRPILNSSENLLKELELQKKYGSRVTLTLLPEEIDKILKEKEV